MSTDESPSDATEVEQTPRFEGEPDLSHLGWIPSVFAGVVAGIAAVSVSSFVAFLCVVFFGDIRSLTDPAELQRWFSEFMQTDLGLCALVLPGQLTFLALAILGSIIARDTIAQRMALQRGRMPPIIWPVLALATPAIGLMSSMVVTQIVNATDLEISQQLEGIEEVLAGFTGSRILLLIALIAFVPGVCEELMFRGFVQSRLLKHWPAWAGIAFSSCFFAAAHIDPMHVAMVFPIGVWLGVIAWKCNSIWPSILGHILNNLFSILLMHWTKNGMDEMEAVTKVFFGTLPFLVISVGLIGALPTQSLREPATKRD